MEEEQFDVLPSPTYVRGFLRTYGEFLGLDGSLLVDEYESRFLRPEDRNSDRRPRAHSGRAAPGRSRGGRRKRGKRRTEAQLLWLAIGGVMGIMLLVWLGAGNGSSSSTPQLATGLPSGPVTPSTQDPALATPEASQPIKIQLIGVAPYGSYVDVREDSASGTELFTGLVARGPADVHYDVVDLAVEFKPDGLQVNVDGSCLAFPSTRRPSW